MLFIHYELTNSFYNIWFYILSFIYAFSDSNHDEGIHIPGGRGRERTREVAQSVPISVPMWPGSRPRAPPEPLDIEVSLSLSLSLFCRFMFHSKYDLFGREIDTLICYSSNSFVLPTLFI